MALNQYLPWAYGGGANVENSTVYAADATRVNGHLTGQASSAKVNTTFRQASVASSALAQVISDVTGIDMLDDGSVTNFKNALNTLLTNTGGNPTKDLLPTLSNTPGNPTTQVTFTAGIARESTNAINLVALSPIIKDLTVAWAAGSGNGGRDTGALAAGQTWHCFIIGTNAGVIDALFSQSRSSPTLPATYTKFRRLGAVGLVRA